MISCEARIFNSNRSRTESSSEEDEPVLKTQREQDFQPYHIKLTDTMIEFYTLKDDLKLTTIFQSNQLNFNFAEKKNLLVISETLNENTQNILAEIKLPLDQIKTIQKELELRRGSEPLWRTVSSKPTLFGKKVETPIEKKEGTNYRGFINMFAVLVVIYNLGTIWESVVNWVTRSLDFDPRILIPVGIVGLLSFHLPAFAAFFIQYLAFRTTISDWVITILNVINVILALWLPIYLGGVFRPHPVPMTVLILPLLVVGTLKIISYAHFMGNLRTFARKELKRDSDVDLATRLSSVDSRVNRENMEVIMKHKDELHKLCDIKHYYYFSLAPLLCFQLVYPRTEKVRFKFLAKVTLRGLGYVFLFGLLAHQYLFPYCEEVLEALDKKLLLSVIIGIMKVSVFSASCWILSFFMIFETIMISMAEIIRLGDRYFYEDWWNNASIAEYWRKWNLPVHHWFVRHLYNPLLKNKVPRLAAQLLIFLISAIAHEYIMAVGIRKWTYCAFIVFSLQAPIVAIQSILGKSLRLKDPQIGNYFFWILFCFILQPILVVYYYAQFISVLY